MSKRMLAPRGTALKTLGCTCHVPEVATLSGDPAAPPESAQERHVARYSCKHLHDLGPSQQYMAVGQTLACSSWRCSLSDRHTEDLLSAVGGRSLVSACFMADLAMPQHARHEPWISPQVLTV